MFQSSDVSPVGPQAASLQAPAALSPGAGQGGARRARSPPREQESPTRIGPGPGGDVHLGFNHPWSYRQSDRLEDCHCGKERQFPTTCESGGRGC